MTQFSNPSNTFDNYQTTEPRKTSGMAITALVLSIIGIIPCCGVITAPIGVILGLIGAAVLGPTAVRKGRGMAITAVVIGLILTGAQIAMLMWMYNAWWAPVINGPVEAMRAGYAGQYSTFKSEFHGAGASASDEQAKEFIDTLRTRYGDFQSIAFDEQNAPPAQPGTPEVEFPYVITFSNATVKARALRVFADQQGGGFVNKWGSIEIIDAEHGNVVYPPAAAPSAPAPPPAGETPAGDGIADEQPPDGDGG